MINIKTIISYLLEKINHPGVQKHSKNIGWMFFAKIGSMVITLLATTYIARNLGPTNYGQLNYAVSFVALFSFIAALGIDNVLYRDFVKYPEQREKYLCSAITLRLLASGFTVLFCVLTAFFLSQKDVSLILIFIISLGFLFNSFHLITYEFQADVRQKQPHLLSLSITIILNILKIIVITYDKGVIYLALIILLESILYTLGYFYLRRKVYGKLRRWSFDKPTAIAILKDSFPLIFATGFITVSARIDQVMLKNMLSTESVGLYSSAVSISEIWYFIPAIIMSSLFPAIINAKKTSEELYQKRVKSLFLFVLLVSISTALVTTFFSKNLVTLIFGGTFIAASPVLQIYVWSNIGGILNSFIQQVLIAENLTKLISILAFLGMLVNVVLNSILIPDYGMSGAAFASLISYCIPLISLIFFKEPRKIIINIFTKSI